MPSWKTRTVKCMLAAALAAPAAAQADSNLADLNADAAAAQLTAVKDGWQGSVALGYLQTTGNANTSTVNGKALVGYKTGPWQDSLLFQALKASQDGLLVAENTNANGQSDYDLGHHNYVFGNLDYLRDVFSGYERRVSEVAGLGHRALDTPTQQLDLELGAGFRQTRYTTGESDHEPVQRAAVSYLWKLNTTNSFTEAFSVVHGSSNTLSQSVTTLTLNLDNSFALSASYTVTHNSSVLEGFKNTDTVTALSLVYSFAPPEPPPPAPAPAAPAPPPP